MPIQKQEIKAKVLPYKLSGELMAHLERLDYQNGHVDITTAIPRELWELGKAIHGEIGVVMVKKNYAIDWHFDQKCKGNTTCVWLSNNCDGGDLETRDKIIKTGDHTYYSFEGYKTEHRATDILLGQGGYRYSICFFTPDAPHPEPKVI